MCKNDNVHFLTLSFTYFQRKHGLFKFIKYGKKIKQTFLSSKFGKKLAF